MESTSAAEPVRKQLGRILSSVGFVRNERLSRFLGFVVEQALDGKADEIKESVVGVEAFGRAPGYDTRSDSVVRTEAAKLRTRLSEYYAGEGASDPLVIELPKGAYTPVFHHREAAREIATIRSAGALLRRGKWRWALAAFACATLLLAAIGLRRFTGQSAPIPIAILPLYNLSPDPANDYFADGLTGEIIRNLSILDGLAVRSQTSSFAFKGKARNVREAGRQLDVEYILEGSVMRAGQQLRINAQLVRVRDDFPLWSGRYDREATDIFAIQDEISRGIVNSLRLKLGRGRRRYETSAEAYNLYLRALAYGKGPGDRGYGSKEQMVLFQQAAAKDPSFAPAYSGLASALGYRSGTDRFDAAERAEQVSQMREAAERAVQLDPLLAEAHEALGSMYARDAKWQMSEKSFRRALELDPNDSSLRSVFVNNLLLPLGRLEESVAEMRLAERSDPLSAYIQWTLFRTLLIAGHLDEAIKHCEKPCIDAMLLQGRAAEAIPILEGLYSGDLSRSGSGILGRAYAHAGRREDAERVARFQWRPTEQAAIFTDLGDKDRAIGALERATRLGPVRFGRELTHPEFVPLRSDPRVKALRKKVGLPD